MCVVDCAQETRTHGLLERLVGDMVCAEKAFARLKICKRQCQILARGAKLARGAVEKDGKPKGYTICATRSVKADPADCYGAFATAAALDRWFGPRHDARIEDGGYWRNADSNQATVKKVNPGKTIRLTWEDGGLTMPTPVEKWLDRAAT